MAKDSPWFKFIPSEWNDGQISLCSYSAKGLFADLIALYWSREGDLPNDFARQKLPADSSLWAELLGREIYSLNDENIVIKFLDEQLSGRIETSKKAKDSIAKRWEKENKKPSNQAKNTVVSGSNYDKNTAVKSSYYDSDTNKKEKRQDKILNPSVGKGFNKDNGVAGKPAKTLPPLRAAGFANDQTPMLGVWKKYGEILAEFVDGGEERPDRAKMIRALDFFWPKEISSDEQNLIGEYIAGRDDIALIVTLQDLAENLKAGEVEKINVKNYFE